MKDQKDSQDQQDQDTSEEKNSPPPTLIEWGIRTICFILVAGLVGYFAYCGWNNNSKPSIEFKITSKKVESRSGSWVVPVSVTNDSDLGIHSLTIESVLKKGNEVSTQQLTTPLLGAREAFDAEFWFKEKPALENLSFEVVTYILP